MLNYSKTPRRELLLKLRWFRCNFILEKRDQASRKQTSRWEIQMKYVNLRCFQFLRYSSQNPGLALASKHTATMKIQERYTPG